MFEHGGNIECANMVAIYRVCEQGGNIECEQGGIIKCVNRVANIECVNSVAMCEQGGYIEC